MLSKIAFWNEGPWKQISTLEHLRYRSNILVSEVVGRYLDAPGTSSRTYPSDARFGVFASLWGECKAIGSALPPAY